MSLKVPMKLCFLLLLWVGCTFGAAFSFELRAIAQPSKKCQTPALCAIIKIDRSRGRAIADVLADLDKVVAQYPTDAAVYKVRSGWREKNKDYSGSLTDLEQALRLEPKDTHLYYDRLWLRQQVKGDPKAILRDYDQLVAVYPQAGEIYMRARFKADELKDFKGALQDYDQAIAIANDSPSYFWNSAITPDEIYVDRAKLKHHNLQDFKGALSDYDRAIQIADYREYHYYHRGQLKAMHLNDRRGAIADLQLFLTLLERENAAKAWGPDVESAKALLARLKAKPER